MVAHRFWLAAGNLLQRTSGGKRIRVVELERFTGGCSHGRPPAFVEEGLAMTTPSTGSLLLSVREAAAALGVSDDLVYEMAARGDLPCLQLGRRRVIPRQAVELLIERSLQAFDAEAVSARLGRSASE